METKRINTTISKELAEKITLCYDTIVSGVPHILEVWEKLKVLELKELQGYFLKEELYYITDMLNSHMLGTHWVDFSKEAFRNSIIDADKYENLAEKWKVDIDNLIEKTNKLTSGQVYFLKEFIKECWNKQKGSNLFEMIDEKLL